MLNMEQLAKHGVWRCSRCQNITGVATFPGRIGVEKYGYCHFCEDATRHLVESVESLAAESAEYE
jgi:hypothetical protein